MNPYIDGNRNNNKQQREHEHEHEQHDHSQCEKWTKESEHSIARIVRLLVLSTIRWHEKNICVNDFFSQHL